jgi:peptidoglycan/xylan/chitin deacetylase (PgdA/CDA1 family)
VPQASINIDIDTLSDDIDGDARIIRCDELRAITYRRVMPRFLELLDRHGVKATFFIIGRDVADHEDVVAAIAASGHELANHTMTHPKQFVHLGDDTIAREIADCSRALERVAGRAIVGFRAPGYTISMRVIDALRRAGYRYDSSLNTSLCYYALKKMFKAVRLTDKDYLSTQRLGDIFGPRGPYRMSTTRLGRPDASASFVEIPISIVPYVSYPFVTSLLLQFGPRPSLRALSWLVSRGAFVNCELHINEFTDRADLNGHNGSFYLTRQYVRIDLAERMTYFDRLITAIRNSCDVVLLRDVTA